MAIQQIQNEVNNLATRLVSLEEEIHKLSLNGQIDGVMSALIVTNIEELVNDCAWINHLCNKEKK